MILDAHDPMTSHADFEDRSCLPEKHHSSLLEHAAFLIDVDPCGREGSGLNIEPRGSRLVYGLNLLQLQKLFTVPWNGHVPTF